MITTVVRAHASETGGLFQLPFATQKSRSRSWAGIIHNSHYIRGEGGAGWYRTVDLSDILYAQTAFIYHRVQSSSYEVY